MKRVSSILVLTTFLLSCHHDDTSYKGKWQQLTFRDGKRVILQPCDVDLREIDINDSTLHIVNQMEYGTQPLKNIDGEKDGFKVIAGETLYQMRWIQKDSGIAAWIIYTTPERPDSFVYVDSTHAHLFKNIQQPAKECE